MFDAYGRDIHYLRLSVTDLCSLRCRYCMPEGVEKLAHGDILTYEEFLRLAALFARCGVDTVRVTGGEPLVRPGVEQLVAGLKATPGIRKVTMTTNGVRLAEKLPALLAAGLDSVNISLDTLDAETFRRITARDELAHVLEGIRAALASGIPAKLNCGPCTGIPAAGAVHRDDAHRLWGRAAQPFRPGTAGPPCPPLAAAAAGVRRSFRRRPGGILFCARLAGERGLHRGGARQILRVLQPGTSDEPGLSAPLPCQRNGHRPARPAARRRVR